MATGLITLTGNISGGPTGGETFGPLQILAATAVIQVSTLTLSANTNTAVTVPTGATAVIIVPPNASYPGGTAPNPAVSGTLTLKGVSGDTGVQINTTYPTELALASGVSSFYLNAASACTVIVWFM